MDDRKEERFLGRSDPLVWVKVKDEVVNPIQTGALLVPPLAMNLRTHDSRTMYL
jgi:hypothetical protein